MPSRQSRTGNGLMATEITDAPCWLRRLRICLQWRRYGFDLWVRKIPRRREWLPAPVFLPGEFHGQKSLAGYSVWSCKESDMAERLTLSLFQFYWSKDIDWDWLGWENHGREGCSHFWLAKKFGRQESAGNLCRQTAVSETQGIWMAILKLFLVA